MLDTVSVHIHVALWDENCCKSPTKNISLGGSFIQLWFSIVDKAFILYFVQRITGLDPAGPYFFPTTFEQPLSPEDALFVDAIHSDTFFIGTKFRVGHADFYPNYNMVQPSCPPFSFNTFFDFVNCKNLSHFETSTDCRSTLKQCAAISMQFDIGLRLWKRRKENCLRVIDVNPGKITREENVQIIQWTLWGSKLIQKWGESFL